MISYTEVKFTEVRKFGPPTGGGGDFRRPCIRHLPLGEVGSLGEDRGQRIANCNTPIFLSRKN